MKNSLEEKIYTQKKILGSLEEMNRVIRNCTKEHFPTLSVYYPGIYDQDTVEMVSRNVTDRAEVHSVNAKFAYAERSGLRTEIVFLLKEDLEKEKANSLEKDIENYFEGDVVAEYVEKKNYHLIP